jgi:hypothetical protein
MLRGQKSVIFCTHLQESITQWKARWGGKGHSHFTGMLLCDLLGFFLKISLYIQDPYVLGDLVLFP